MMRLLLVSGHTSGYNRCQATDCNEGDLNIALVKELARLMESRCEVKVYPYDADLYLDTRAGTHKMSLANFDLVFEIHHNGFNGQANGCEIYHPVSQDGERVKLCHSILDNMKRLGYASRGVKTSTAWANINYCNGHGIPYLLFETCFYDSVADMGHYNVHSIANAIADALTWFYGLDVPHETRLYRVQVGAFADYNNAKNLKNRLTEQGFDAIIKEEK